MIGKMWRPAVQGRAECLIAKSFNNTSWRNRSMRCTPNYNFVRNCGHGSHLISFPARARRRFLPAGVRCADQGGQIPSQSYTTHTASSLKGGKPQSSETICVQRGVYIRGDGKWRKTPVRTEDVLKQEKENRERGKATCQFMRNEFIGAKPAMVHSQRERGRQGRWADVDIEEHRSALKQAIRMCMSEGWRLRSIGQPALSTATFALPCRGCQLPL
jgi:hypothetical protein